MVLLVGDQSDALLSLAKHVAGGSRGIKETTAVLKQAGNLCYLFELRCKHRGRDSVETSAWARMKAKATSRGLLKEAGKDDEADSLTALLTRHGWRITEPDLDTLLNLR